MRIAFFVHRFPALSETFILNQITGLLDHGHQVMVFSEWGAEGSVVHPDVEAYRLMDRVVRVSDGAQRLGELAWTRSLALRAPGTFLRMRRKGAGGHGGRRPLGRKLAILARSGFVPDVVHAHFGDVALRSRFATLLWPVPFVASFYGHDASRVPLRDGADVYEPLHSTAQRVTVLSGEMRRRLVDLGFPDHRVREHRIGVDPDRFPFRERRKDPGADTIELLTVARLVEKKGVDYALRALAPLAERFRFRYRIIGDGPLRGALEERSRGLGLEERVEFMGSATQDRVRAAIDEADLFLLPSVTAADGDREGTPTVLMEASASGLPVVATHHAGIPEVVLDGVTGALVPERDVEALTRALEDTFAAPGVWPFLGRRGREHIVRRYNIRRLAPGLVELYRELLAGAPVGASPNGAHGSSRPTTLLAEGDQPSTPPAREGHEKDAGRGRGG